MPRSKSGPKKDTMCEQEGQDRKSQIPVKGADYMDSKHSTAWFIGVLFVLVAGTSRPAYCAPPSDPCSLLTQGQVSSVLGVQVGEGQRVATKLCEWSVPGAPGLNVKKVTVTLQDAQSFAYAKMPVGHGITKITVSGIGDEAIYGTTPRFATTLTVKKGGFFFVVHVWGFPLDQTKAIDDVQAKEKTLALQILSKL